MAEKSWRHDFPLYNIWEFFFSAQGHVTPVPAVWFCWNSNSVKILCHSCLPIRMKKFWLKMVKKVEDTLFCYFAQGQISYGWLVQSRQYSKLIKTMSFLVTWKLEEAQIKNGWEKLETLFPHNNSYGKCFQRSRACNSETYCLILPKF